ncbi:AMP-binding protein [Ilumatobacter sp.]|uniref:AMP-binding protein n=1 Tax=Ilumatobacter sp. TaxID=1967498 RepID=UPI003B52E3A7
MGGHQSTVIPSSAGDRSPGVLSVGALRARGDDVALVEEGRTVSYAALADRVERRGAEIGTRRRVVVALASTSVELVVTYLAALEGRHPVIVLDGASDQQPTIDAYRPDVVARCDPAGTILEHRRPVDEAPVDPEPHPDLAVLLTTSGSTGGRKLVRLPTGAVTSNALAIAAALGLAPDDRAITSLPLHYCYGLSVITSHLAIGASVVVETASVVDPCFWASVERWGVTTVSAVPHTFTLVDRVGIDVLEAPSLRRVTQAGGRLAPRDVERFARHGRDHGWDLHVMYGQTEATARIACLAPDRVLDHPDSVGRAIPGGSLRLVPVDDGSGPTARGRGGRTGPVEVGEIAYRGPNVMMGYATSRDDLARGADLDELRTGDLGRFTDDGELVVVGRRTRFLKLHGMRVELDQLEAELAARGWRAWCTGDDDGLVVAIAGERDASHPRLRDDVLDVVAVPAGLVAAVEVGDVPVTSSGKVDLARLTSLGRAVSAAERAASGGRSRWRRRGGSSDDATVADAFGDVLGVARVAPDDTFVSLGGDSLSYVELSIRLERLLADLPRDWHLTTVSALDEFVVDDRSDRRWTVRVETSVVVRAIAIAIIVCTHMRVWRVAGGAHTLLAVIGFNFARFQLSAADLPGHLRRGLATVGRVAVPTSVWIGLNMAVAGGYGLSALLLVNNYTGSGHRTDGRWEYWYFEAFAQIVVALTLVFSVSRVRGAERRAPFGFALGVLALTLLFRFDVVSLGGEYNEVFRPHTVASFVALGWAAQRATTVWRRAVVTAAAALVSIGFFASVGIDTDQLDRELRILAMIAALIWIPTVRLPRPVADVVGVLAAASMHVFLVHWQVWPLLTPWMDDRAAWVATMAVGVGVWWLVGRTTDVVTLGWRQFRSRSDARTVGRSTSVQVSTADTEISTSDAAPVSA